MVTNESANFAKAEAALDFDKQPVILNSALFFWIYVVGGNEDA